MKKSSFAPLTGNNPEILILGTLPGEESLKRSEYYANPTNRFWPLIARLTEESLPKTYDEKKQMLAAHGIALWDVVQSARRENSADINITDEKPNDIIGFIEEHPLIHTVAFNGKKAEELFLHYFEGEIAGMRFVSLRSTSPANRQFSDAEMQLNWAQIFDNGR
jgi:hypoxanthine-DNA glycosylase